MSLCDLISASIPTGDQRNGSEDRGAEIQNSSSAIPPQLCSVCSKIHSEFLKNLDSTEIYIQARIYYLHT